MSKNKNLIKAKKEKNDEFYTQYKDIEKELKHYKEYFKDKIVYCNCDNPKYSNFWKYFFDNFHIFKISKLVSTYYSNENIVYKTEYDGINIISIKLDSDGDFRNQECIDILKESDIIVTNPPFSLFREYITQLIKYNKKFIIVGNKNSVISKQIFSFFVNNEVNYGINNISNFIKKDGNIQKFGNVGWFTNIIVINKNKKLELTKKYNDNDYCKYCNYNAINVDKIKDIPIDYNGVMGVPITFLEKYNSNQFEILGIDRLGYSEKLGIEPIGEKWCKDYFGQGNKGHLSPKMKLLVLYENGLAKVKYLRVLIKRIDI